MDLSKTDFRLLDALQEDCRQSLKELSRKLKLPSSTVHGKIKKLEQEKVIESYSAVVDAEKLGENVTVFVVSQVAGMETGKVFKPRDIAQQLARLPYVLECHVVTGQYDLLMKIKGRNMKEIGSLIMDQVSIIPGIRNTQTMEAFFTAKETPAIDLSQYEKSLQK